MDLIDRQEAIDAMVELCKHYTPTKSVFHPHIDFVIEELNRLPSAQPEPCKDASSIYAIMKDYYFEHKDEHDASWQSGFGKCMNLIPNVFEKQQKMEPCEDAVSRWGVINAIENGKPYQQDADDIAEMVQNMPSVMPEHQWIPCSERLPEIKNSIGERVIVTTLWGLVREAYYCFNHWEINDIDYKLSAVIAWMPLPEPYKEES